ncbi:unnamed protein product [Rhizophagus irregularis]|nr:unnamed protein product [Rhizophagus irregularis]
MFDLDDTFWSHISDVIGKVLGTTLTSYNNIGSRNEESTQKFAVDNIGQMRGPTGYPFVEIFLDDVTYQRPTGGMGGRGAVGF